MSQHLGDKAHTTLLCLQGREKRKCRKIKTKRKKKVDVGELLLPPGLANHEVCTAHTQYPDT